MIGWIKEPVWEHGVSIDILGLPQNPVGNMGSPLAFLACPKSLLGTWDCLLR